MPGLYTDLHEIKTMLEIDPGDTSEDKKLNFLNEHMSSWVEEIIGRPGQIVYKSRTQYYDGTGTMKLLLKARPVFPLADGGMQVWLDQSGAYGSSPTAFTQPALTYGTDYCVAIDQDDGVSSRCGILLRLNNYWPNRNVRQNGLLFPFKERGRGNVKVTYTAGYTVDTLPGAFREAMDLLIARARYLWPLGFPLSSESYEDRSISLMADLKTYLTGLVKPMLAPYRNNWLN